MNLINFPRKKEYFFECNIKEYVDENSRNYSNHLQNFDAKMFIRWDNAPHHKNLITFSKFTQQQIRPAIGGGNVI